MKELGKEWGNFTKEERSQYDEMAAKGKSQSLLFDFYFQGYTILTFII